MQLIDKLELEPTLPTWLWIYKISEGKGYTIQVYTEGKKTSVLINPDLMKEPTHPVRIILEEREVTMEEWKDSVVGSPMKWTGGVSIIYILFPHF